MSDSEIIIVNNELTPQQHKIADKIYDIAHKTIQEILYSPSIDDLVLLVKSVSKVAGLSEMIKINDRNLRGFEKRAIVVYLTRKIIQQHAPAYRVDSLLRIYDSCGINLLEIMIDFAKNNKLVKKISLGSCLC